MVQWKISMDSEEVVAAPGEKVTFTWAGTHDLYVMVSESAMKGCDFAAADGTLVAGRDGSPATVTFAGPEPQYYSCSVSDHCDKGQQLAVVLPAQDILALADATPQLSTLVAAVGAAGLAEALSGSPFTVFAPTNKAFEPLDLEYYLKPENKGELTDILLYHVLASTVMSSDLTDGQEAATVYGDTVTVSLGDGVMINDATVTTADVRASNGVVHIIDKVLFPPGVEPKLKPTVYDVIDDTEGLSRLAKALKSNNLDDEAREDVITVFAPTTAAFEKSEDNPLELAFYLADPKSVLKYHMVAGRLTSSELEDGMEIVTLQGDTIEVSTRDGKVRLKDELGNLAEFEQVDLEAYNGYVHVIDTVLYPNDDGSDGAAKTVASLAATAAGAAAALLL